MVSRSGWACRGTAEESLAGRHPQGEEGREVLAGDDQAADGHVERQEDRGEPQQAAPDVDGNAGHRRGRAKTFGRIGEHLPAGLLGQAGEERLVLLRIRQVGRIGNGEAEGLLRVEPARARGLQADRRRTRSRGPTTVAS